MPERQDARSAAKDQDDFAGSAGPREHALRPFGDLTKDWPLTRRGRVYMSSAASTDLWVEITLRLPQDEFVHPDIVRDDLLEALDAVSWSNVETAAVTDTSPGYMET